MGTVVKIGIVTALIGAGLWLYDYAKQAIAAFTFSIVSYGSPTFSNGFLQVPLTVQFNNASPVPINLDSLHADIFIQKYGQWVKAGQIDQPLSIPPGVTNQTLVPSINIASIISGGITSLLTQAVTALQNQSVPVRTDITVSYAGVVLPTKSFTNKISIA